MKKLFLGVLIASGVLFTGCNTVDEKALESNLRAQIESEIEQEKIEKAAAESAAKDLANEAIDEAIEALRDEVKKADEDAIKKLTSGYDVFEIGETATVTNINITIDSAKFVEPIAKQSGKMSDFAIEIAFTIENNFSMKYQPTGDMKVFIAGEQAEQNASLMSPEEREAYGAGVEPGETKSFRIWFLSNAEQPIAPVAQWEPRSSMLGSKGLYIYVDLSSELREQWLDTQIDAVLSDAGLK